jgi:hypothetical protein
MPADYCGFVHLCEGIVYSGRALALGADGQALTVRHPRGVFNQLTAVSIAYAHTLCEPGPTRISAE